jgi:hypothetical protein
MLLLRVNLTIASPVDTSNSPVCLPFALHDMTFKLDKLTSPFGPWLQMPADGTRHVSMPCKHHVLHCPLAPSPAANSSLSLNWIMYHLPGLVATRARWERV